MLQPFGDNQRYDLVVEDGGKFLRIQCKTGRVTPKGSLDFATCSSQAHRGRGRQDYRGQIELFGVYSPELDKVYLVPVDAVPITHASLRLRPSGNNQTTGTRWAKDYELVTIPE